MFAIDESDFVIDATADGFRVKRIDVTGNLHTHLRNKSACYSVIQNVINKKIPKKTDFYYLESLIRLSTDIEYINKVQSLIDVRKHKGKKSNYFNPQKGKN